MRDIETIRNTKYVFAWGEKYPTPVLDMIARIDLAYPNLVANNIEDYVCGITGRNTIRGFYSQRALEKIAAEHGVYFLDKKNITKLLKDYDQLALDYDELFSRYNKIDFSSLSNEEIAELFEEYAAFAQRSIGLFRMTREEGETGPIDKIRQVLAKYYEPDVLEEQFRALTQSTEIDAVGQERIEWLRILENPWDEGAVKKYILRFSANFLNMYDWAEIFVLLHDRYQNDQKHKEEIRQELEDQVQHKAALREQQKAIYDQCDSNEDLWAFSKMIQDFGVYRFKMKHYWAGAELKCLPFFEDICRRLEIGTKDFFDLYLMEDIIAGLKEGKTLTADQIAEREKCIVIWLKDKKYRNFFGEEGLEVLAEINKSANHAEEIRGRVAYPGIVRGRVRIVHATNMEDLTEIAKSFKEGDILVAENTQPSMVVLMKKAAAIVTDQGGLTSHAAIVAREFKKPCIVGTRVGTRLLKDGDMVEVDANMGVVQILAED